jgi:hypothetical protein
LHPIHGDNQIGPLEYFNQSIEDDPLIITRSWFQVFFKNALRIFNRLKSKLFIRHSTRLRGDQSKRTDAVPVGSNCHWLGISADGPKQEKRARISGKTGKNQATPRRWGASIASKSSAITIAPLKHTDTHPSATGGRGQAYRPGVQAIIVAIDHSAEKATGNRDSFLNKPQSIGGSGERYSMRSRQAA